jgi:hypothetical protein
MPSFAAKLQALPGLDFAGDHGEDDRLRHHRYAAKMPASIASPGFKFSAIGHGLVNILHAGFSRSRDPMRNQSQHREGKGCPDQHRDDPGRLRQKGVPARRVPCLPD